MKILMIVPAYNEEENILNTCQKIKEFSKELDYIVFAWTQLRFSFYIEFSEKRRFSKNYVNQAIISISIGWSGHVFWLLYMMISVPLFIAPYKVRGAVFQCFLSFYVANLLFVLWGVVNGWSVWYYFKNCCWRTKEVFHETNTGSHYGTGTKSVCNKIWTWSNHVFAGV